MKMTYTKSAFEMPDGKYLAKFLGTTLRDDPPGAGPRLGQDGKPLPPAMTWDFEIVEGPEAGKKADKLTGRIPTPKSGCGKMLAAVSDSILKDGQEIDLAQFVGALYRITVLENRVSDNPAPVRVYGAANQPAAEFPKSPTISGAATHGPANGAPLDGPPPGDAVGADPDARWDYHDGTAWKRGASTYEVQLFMAQNARDPALVWVKPSGGDPKAQPKKAADFGLKADPIPF